METIALGFAALGLIVIAYGVIVNRVGRPVLSEAVVTVSQYQDLAVSHAQLSTRLQSLERAYDRLKAELVDEREARKADREAWAVERRALQAEIAALRNRIVGIEPPGDIYATGDSPVTLREFIAARFTMQELQLLVTDLGGKWDEIEDTQGGMPSTSLRAVQWFARRNITGKLEAAVHRARPG